MCLFSDSGEVGQCGVSDHVLLERSGCVATRCIILSSCLLLICFLGYRKTKSESGAPKLDFDGLSPEIQGRVLGYLPYKQVFQLKSISKSVKTLVESNEFQASPSRKIPTLTACYFFIHNGVWSWAGLDPSTQEWRLLPPLTFLPSDCIPDPDLFKEFLICANKGLVCINFSKSPDAERLIVFNPLSKIWTPLPPLTHRRNPVLMHMLVDLDQISFQLIVAGSAHAAPGDGDLSRITEVFDSRTRQWERTGDVVGPLFALNEYQSGVYQDGKLFCIGFVEEGDQVGKGIMAYDVKKGSWSSKWVHLLPFCASCTILQLVECSGEVYVFSEREIGRFTEHWVDRVEWTLGDGDGRNGCELVNVVQKPKTGGRSLEAYPEYVCVPYGEGRLGIVNAIDHSGEVYDVQEQGHEAGDNIPPLAGERFRGELGFFTLNPMSFTIEPRFSSKINQHVSTGSVQTTT